MTVTGGHDTRVSLAALIATRPGRQPWLIYRTHRARRGDKRKGFTETDYARFLDAAHQQLGGPLVLVWDGLNTHTSRAMRELIAARTWLTVFQLPAYAPELNPVEPVWSNLKRSLANLVKQDINQLTALVKTRLQRMQYPARPAGRLPGQDQTRPHAPPVTSTIDTEIVSTLHDLCRVHAVRKVVAAIPRSVARLIMDHVRR